MRIKLLFAFLIALSCRSVVSGQIQIGQGLNDLYNKAPEIHNLALIPLTSVPAGTLIAGSRLNGFDKHPFQGSFLCSAFLVDHLGAGLRINYDRDGILAKTDVQLGLTYYVFLSKAKVDGSNKDRAGDKFSFFLAGHYVQDRLNQKDILVLDPNDPNILNTRNTAQNGNASVGIAFLRENKYYFGISAYQLLPGKSPFMNPAIENLKKPHYFILASYTIDIGKYRNYAIELLGGSVFRDLETYQLEAGAEFKIKRICSLGAAYRNNGSLKFDIDFTSKSWDFGYAFSYGAWADARIHTYKGINNMIFIRKLINEGRKVKE